MRFYPHKAYFRNNAYKDDQHYYFFMWLIYICFIFSKTFILTLHRSMLSITSTLSSAGSKSKSCSSKLIKKIQINGF